MPVVFLHSTTSLQALEDSHYWLWDCGSQISKYLQWSSLHQINLNASNSITLPLSYSFLIVWQDLTSLSLLLVSLVLSSVNNFQSLLSSDPILCLVFLLLLMNLQNDVLFPLIILLLANLFYAWPSWLCSCMPLLSYTHLLCSNLLLISCTLPSQVWGQWGICELTRLFLIYFFIFYQEAAPPGAEEDKVAEINKAGAAVPPPCSSGRRRLRGQVTGWQLY